MNTKEELIKRLERLDLPNIKLPRHRQNLNMALLHSGYLTLKKQTTMSLMRKFATAGTIALAAAVVAIGIGYFKNPGSSVAYAKQLAQSSYHAVLSLSPAQQIALGNRIGWNVSTPAELLREATNANDLSTVSYNQFMHENAQTSVASTANTTSATSNPSATADMHNARFLQFTAQNGEVIYLAIEQNNYLPIMVTVMPSSAATVFATASTTAAASAPVPATVIVQTPGIRHSVTHHKELNESTSTNATASAPVSFVHNIIPPFVSLFHGLHLGLFKHATKLTPPTTPPSTAPATTTSTAAATASAAISLPHFFHSVLRDITSLSLATQPATTSSTAPATATATESITVSRTTSATTPATASATSSTTTSSSSTTSSTTAPTPATSSATAPQTLSATAATTPSTAINLAEFSRTNASIVNIFNINVRNVTLNAAFMRMFPDPQAQPVTGSVTGSTTGAASARTSSM